MFNSLAAGVKKQPELVSVRFQPQDEECEAGWTAPPGGSDGCGNPGYCAVSLSYLRCNRDAPLGRDSAVGRVPSETRSASRGYGFRLGRREQNPQTPQPGWERSAAKRSVPAAWQRRRSTSATWRVPSSRRDQLRTAERCPGKKDLNTPAAGLAGNEGLKHPVTPARAAGRELRQIRSGSASLVGLPFGKDPGNGEGCPQISRAGNLEKPEHADIVAPADRPGYPLRAPPANC